MRRANTILSVFGVLIGIQAATAQQIPDRATLDGILGGNQVLEDFETYDVDDGLWADLNIDWLDETTVVNGQGPGLVQPGVWYMAGSLGDFQWNGDSYYEVETKTLQANQYYQDIDITIFYPDIVQAMGIDLREMQAFPDSGTVEVYDYNDELISTTVFSFDTGGAENVFFGWRHDEGIWRVVIKNDWYSWSPMIDNHGYGMTGLALSIEGSCPGLATLNVSGATPNATIGFGYGFSGGSTPVPGCPGLTVNIANAQLAGTDIADGAGNASTQGFVPGAACGLLHIQAVDLSACKTSNIVWF